MPLLRSAMGLLLGGVLLVQANAANGAQVLATDASKKGTSDQSLSRPWEILTDDPSLPGLMQVLSDTMGVDFNPYLSHVLHNVKQHWYELIPESAAMKRGKVVLEFAILKDGSVAGLKIAESSGDINLDRPAYGSITGSNPFPPLAKEFSGPYLLLSFSYYYNEEIEKPELNISPVESTVATGATVQFRAVENYKNAAVTWSIIGCDNTCGTISSAGLYTAPAKMPSSKVTIRATVILIPNRSTETTVTIVEPKP